MNLGILGDRLTNNIKLPKHFFVGSGSAATCGFRLGALFFQVPVIIGNQGLQYAVHRIDFFLANFLKLEIQGQKRFLVFADGFKIFS